MSATIDLHMHTYFSNDGQYSPQELVDLVKQSGIQVMAIADHNSAKANIQAEKCASTLNIQYIHAIEIDCTFLGVNLHVLGYGIHPTNPMYQQLENNVYQQEVQSSLKKLALTNDLGFSIKKEQLDQLSSDGVYTGEMFAEVLLHDALYDDHPLLKKYRPNGSRSDNPYVNFYWDYYAQGKPCYVAIYYPSLEEIIALLHDDGALSVLAHPGNNLKNNYELFDKIIQQNIDGVEAFSSYHSKEACEYFYNKGTLHNLLITCGSDFHGKTKPSISLGQSNCTIDPTIIYNQLVDKGLLKHKVRQNILYD